MKNREQIKLIHLTKGVSHKYSDNDTEIYIYMYRKWKRYITRYQSLQKHFMESYYELNKTYLYIHAIITESYCWEVVFGSSWCQNFFRECIWIMKHAYLKNYYQNHNTFRLVFSRLNEKEFQHCVWIVLKSFQTRYIRFIWREFCACFFSI